jgi:hypothetical protein
MGLSSVIWHDKDTAVINLVAEKFFQAHKLMDHPAIRAHTMMKVRTLPEEQSEVESASDSEPETEPETEPEGPHDDVKPADPRKQRRMRRSMLRGWL